MTVIHKNLKIKLKNNNKRKISSQRWLRRQLNDKYGRSAREDGMKSRAAYKLMQINEKFDLLKDGLTVVDVGSAPGGWSQVVSDKIKGNIYAFDILPMDEIYGVNFIQGDFFNAEENLQAIGEVDLILSDIAPSFCGDAVTDHVKIMNMCEKIMVVADSYLKKGGNMVMKILVGKEDANLATMLRERFNTVKYYKPDASRKESRETYLVSLGKKQ